MRAMMEAEIKAAEADTEVVPKPSPAPNPVPPAGEKLITDPIIEKAIREELKTPSGELTKADLEKVTKLFLYSDQLSNQLTDVSAFANLTQLKELWLDNNPALTKAQIDELKKALPKCTIASTPTK